MSSKYSRVAILIKTCRGRPSLLWVLNSIKYGMEDVSYRIYISDEKPLDDWKIPVYERLREEGHHIETLERGIGCGVARNKLLENLRDEELVLRLDDDFELGGEFNFPTLETIVKSAKEIGFCSDFERQIGNGRKVRSGAIRPAGGEFKIVPPKLIMKFHSPWRRFKRVSGIRYALAEHTRNLLLIKREVVEKVKWNEKLLFRGEHSEFMLSVKEAGYLGAYTPDSIHYHRDDLTGFRSTGDKKSKKHYRPGEKEKKRVLMDKIGCNKVITSYPASWYILEGGRYFLDKLSL